MPAPPDDTRTAILAATVTAASSVAFQVGGKATRDALFLTSVGAAHLPVMTMATALLAIGFALISSRALLSWGPGRVVPIGYGGSAALLLLEWGVSLWRADVAAVLVYLHCGAVGGLLISGFWSVINERFDPRTVKRRLGAIAAWGTLGGVLGGFITARVGSALPVTAMLPMLALLHFVACLSVARVGMGAEAAHRPVAPRRTAVPEPLKSGLQIIGGSRYLRGLVALVLLVTVSEGLIDLAFKNRAAASMAHPEELLPFFAVFYAVTSLITLLIQTGLGRLAMDRLGPARAAAVLPLGVGAASAGALAVPGLTTSAVARGTESVLSNSLFRSSFEVLFTPVSAREKRAVKPLADVGAARVGDLIAAGIAQATMALAAVHASALMTAVALAVSVLAAWTAARLNQGYVASLERGLRSRAVELDLSEVRDRMTRTVMMRTLGPLELSRILPSRAGLTVTESGRLGELRSGEVRRIRKALRQETLTRELIPEAIALLAQDDVARDAIEVLRGAGPEVVEPLVAGLLDPSQEFAVRRRIPLVLATHRHPRAVEGMAQGLADRRFEVRYRCGRGLSHLTELDPTCRVEARVIYEAVRREVEVGAGVWEGRRLLDRMDDEGWSPVVDGAIRERANKSLEHVFTLLALVLPREPLRIAFRGLHVTDPFLRGTALEYLESALPTEIRKALWPYLEDQRPRRGAVRPTEEALAKLLQSSESIVIHLDELRRKETPD